MKNDFCSDELKELVLTKETVQVDIWYRMRFMPEEYKAHEWYRFEVYIFDAKARDYRIIHNVFHLGGELRQVNGAKFLKEWLPIAWRIPNVPTTFMISDKAEIEFMFECGALTEAPRMIATTKCPKCYHEIERYEVIDPGEIFQCEHCNDNLVIK